MPLRGLGGGDVRTAGRGEREDGCERPRARVIRGERQKSIGGGYGLSGKVTLTH